MVAIALRTIGEATRFFRTRHRVRTRIGPYVVTTTEVRPSAFETTVTWGEGGAEVERFRPRPALDRKQADDLHERLCEEVEEATGLRRLPLPPAA